MVGFGIAIAAIAPVTWGWKIALFLVIMFLVGIVIPAIWWARRNPN
jgi:type IV secretory pathway TrbD component